MKWTSILAIYALFWVMSAFVVLPFHARTGAEAGDALVAGQADSAPANFRPARAAWHVTIVATALFGLYYVAYVNDWIDVKALVEMTNNR